MAETKQPHMKQYFESISISGNRLCQVCKEQKPEEDFSKQRSKYKNTGLCKQCKREATAVWTSMSNCTDYCLNKPTIFKTIDSWKKTFGEPEQLHVFVDPNPNPNKYEKYKSKLNKKGIEPIKTTSLSDSYIKALDIDVDYIFFVEHDWLFQDISHSLDAILDGMERDNLWFMLFNKRQNRHTPDIAKWQTYLRPSKRSWYCESDRASNNPHIVDVQQYRQKAMPLVNWSLKGAGRIEQSLEKKFTIAIYGEYDKKPTITHLDGSRSGNR